MTEQKPVIGSPEYYAWAGMKRRCYSEKYACYHRYGGRGITVCERWLGKDGFVNFFNDVGPRPSNKHSLDRRKVNEGYYPENVHWATQEVQARNKENNRFLTFKGETLCLADWAKKLNMFATTIGRRIDAGWTTEEILTTPKGKRRKKSK